MYAGMCDMYYIVRKYAIALIVVSVVYTAGSFEANGQVVLLNRRTDTVDQYVRVVARAEDDPGASGAVDAPAPVIDTDLTLAFGTVSASVPPNCYASSTAEASNVTAPNSTTAVPQVDSTASVESEADMLQAAMWAVTADAYGDYLVVSNPSAPAVTSGTLVSEMYVVVNGGEGSVWDLDMLLLSAPRVDVISADSFVTCIGNSGSAGWDITGLLKSNSGPDVSLSYFVPGGSLNEYFPGAQSVTVGQGFTVRSRWIMTGGTASSGGGSQLRGFSATSSYSIQ